VETIGFLGSGNMAEAFIKGITGAQVWRPEDTFVSDVRPERLSYLKERYKIMTVESNEELAHKADIIILSVKPQQINEAMESIKEHLREESQIISIVAGVRIQRISDLLGDRPILRIMPNTPLLIGQGAIAIFANEKGQDLAVKAEAILACVGKVFMVENEDLIDVVTAVSGSGPAYYFLLMEEMIKAGIALGLDEGTAKGLVLQTAKGAALLAENADNEGESAGQLRKKVTSPGGTTEAALKTFAQGEFGKLVSEAIKKACQRSKELSN
jgi:pyrroline-5-carboxylate reductase